MLYFLPDAKLVIRQNFGSARAFRPFHGKGVWKRGDSLNYTASHSIMQVDYRVPAEPFQMAAIFKTNISFSLFFSARYLDQTADILFSHPVLFRPVA